jgi:hypothetical protein
MDALDFQEGDLFSLTSTPGGEWLLERNNMALRGHAMNALRPASSCLQRLPCEPAGAAAAFLSQADLEPKLGSTEGLWERRYRLYEEESRKKLGDEAQVVAERQGKDGEAAKMRALRVRDEFVRCGHRSCSAISNVGL